MTRKLSGQEFHALYCPAKNTKSALFLVAYFSLTMFINWKGLHKVPEHLNFAELLFGMFVVAMLAKWLVAFTCFRERLIFGLIIVALAAGAIERFVLSKVSQHVEAVKSGHLALSLLGLLVSLTLLARLGRTPDIGPSNAEALKAWQPKHSLLILLVATLTVLALGALLYFIPFPN